MSSASLGMPTLGELLINLADNELQEGAAMTDEDVTFSADDDRHRNLRARREHAATGPPPPAIAAGFTVGRAGGAEGALG